MCVLQVCVLQVCVLCVSRYSGQIGAHLILGGVDYSGAHLYTVGPYGSMNKLPYVSMGQCALLMWICGL